MLYIKKEKKPTIKSILNSPIKYRRFKIDYQPIYPPFLTIDLQ